MSRTDEFKKQAAESETPSSNRRARARPWPIAGRPRVRAERAAATRVHADVAQFPRLAAAAKLPIAAMLPSRMISV